MQMCSSIASGSGWSPGYQAESGCPSSVIQQNTHSPLINETYFTHTICQENPLKTFIHDYSNLYPHVSVVPVFHLPVVHKFSLPILQMTFLSLHHSYNLSLCHCLMCLSVFATGKKATGKQVGGLKTMFADNSKMGRRSNRRAAI